MTQAPGMYDMYVHGLLQHMQAGQLPPCNVRQHAGLFKLEINMYQHTYRQTDLHIIK